jgi:hypothetical protein
MLATAPRLRAFELTSACARSPSLALGLGFKDFHGRTKFDSVQEGFGGNKNPDQVNGVKTRGKRQFHFKMTRSKITEK